MPFSFLKNVLLSSQIISFDKTAAEETIACPKNMQTGFRAVFLESSKSSIHIPQTRHVRKDPGLQRSLEDKQSKLLRLIVYKGHRAENSGMPAGALWAKTPFCQTSPLAASFKPHSHCHAFNLYRDSKSMKISGKLIQGLKTLWS